MPLFSAAQAAKIKAVAAKSKEVLEKPKAVNKKASSELEEASQKVLEYFHDSKAILIQSKEQLHDYITECIKAGYAGIDTETTGLDRINDHIVGSSLYYPGGNECYIPNKHLIPIFDEPRKNQLTYEDCHEEFQRLVDNHCKMIFANADFDIAMLYHDYKVDFIDACYYDVILAWRCIKEDEPDNRLKTLYAKYVRGLDPTNLPHSFSDFFSVTQFPYCKPEIAKLYAANDARITYDLFVWQLPYVTKTNSLCKKYHLEKIADIVWGIEIPMIRPCSLMNRVGMYLDDDIIEPLQIRYHALYQQEEDKLRAMVQKLIDEKDIPNNPKRPFKTAKDFGPKSTPHVQYLCYDLLKLPIPTSGKNKGKKATGKDVLADAPNPEIKQLMKVRSLATNISTFVDKMPAAIGPDHRIHSRFNSIGAATGRMSSADPNTQNIPSKHTDIRHLFRANKATNQYIIISKDTYSAELTCHDTILTERGPSKTRHIIPNETKVQLCVDSKLCYFLVKSINKDEENDFIKLTFNKNDLDIYNEIKFHYQTPPMIMVGSDYSQQEPKMCAFLCQDEKMVDAFKKGRDIYATIAGLSFNMPYEKCLEFHPETHEYQPEGKARRSEAKTIVLGILYGRSVASIGDQLFGDNDQMTDEEKTKRAQGIYDAVLTAFPKLRSFMNQSQANARKYGYVETILGRRRHIPKMQLPEFEFHAMPGYVNPDIDPLDPTTLENKDQIPQRIIDALTKEYKHYKYNGQIYKRNKQLYEIGIKVTDNRREIGDASRECVNSQVQGSAAELTKMAILRLTNDPRWKKVGGKLLVPVHDELIGMSYMEDSIEAGKVLADDMCQAGNFLPFTISTDVEHTTRWYGLSFPCMYTKPKSLDRDSLTEDEVKWIQYHLFDQEYLLPVFKEEDGSKPRGDAAHGVQGKQTDEMWACIDDYCKKHNISKDQFISHIEKYVAYGLADFWVTPEDDLENIKKQFEKEESE